MLVLSRKIGEKIKIADDIEISIVDIRGDKVRISVEAPQAVTIHRSEVYEKIKAQEAKEASSQVASDPAVQPPC